MTIGASEWVFEYEHRLVIKLQYIFGADGDYVMDHLCGKHLLCIAAKKLVVSLQGM